MSASTTTIRLGEKDDIGTYVEILRPINDTLDDYIQTFIQYECHGVVDIDVQLPDPGVSKPHIGVEFANGSTEYFEGHIHDFGL